MSSAVARGGGGDAVAGGLGATGPARPALCDGPPCTLRPAVAAPLLLLAEPAALLARLGADDAPWQCGLCTVQVTLCTGVQRGRVEN